VQGYYLKLDTDDFHILSDSLLTNIPIILQCVQPFTECTYLGTKIDQLGDNTTEIKHRVSQTRKAINALKPIWWQKNVTKNKKNNIFIKL
jgi:hypothetical protein